MDLPTILAGAIFIIIGLAYILIPQKIFPYDEWTITKKGIKKEIPKINKEWIKKAKIKGTFFIIGGLLITFIQEIINLLYTT